MRGSALEHGASLSVQFLALGKMQFARSSGILLLPVTLAFNALSLTHMLKLYGYHLDTIEYGFLKSTTVTCAQCGHSNSPVNGNAGGL